jgi:hypothetical protein
MSPDCLVRGKTVFIMGGGKFGTNALRYLKANGCKIIVADINPDCQAKSEVTVQTNVLKVLDSLKNGHAAFLEGNAIDLLLAIMEKSVPDLIVTAIPGNIIAEVVKGWLAKHKLKLETYNEVIPKVLENIPKSLLSFVDKDLGVVIVSYMPAPMRCRKNCMPPKNVCALTGRTKLTSMDRLLKFCVYNQTDISRILLSKQLTGGLGAVEGIKLCSLFEQLEKLHAPYTLAIGTACDCHGVLNLLKIKK